MTAPTNSAELLTAIQQLTRDHYPQVGVILIPITIPDPVSKNDFAIIGYHVDPNARTYDQWIKTLSNWTDQIDLLNEDQGFDVCPECGNDTLDEGFCLDCGWQPETLITIAYHQPEEDQPPPTTH